MPHTPTVLVADSVDGRRRTFGLALYEGGYEVINAVNGEEALRFTAGLNPDLVVVHTGLDGLEPDDLHARLKATGLSVPPFLVLTDGSAPRVEELDDDSIYLLSDSEAEPHRFLQQVRLLLLARQMGGELSDSIDVLYGDLTRISIGELLQVLSRAVLTGHVTLTVGPEAGIWLKDGKVIEAHWGPVNGRKAFNRVAALRGGTFVVTLEEPTVPQAIDVDLASLVSDAVDEKFQLDHLFRTLPSLDARVRIQMGEDFFAVEFTPLEREVLTRVQKAKRFADLIDLVPATDLEVLQAVLTMMERGFVQLVEPERRIHVVTDSICDLTPDVLRRNQITVVPLTVLFGKNVFKDGIDLYADQFYQMLQSSPVMPSTSPPSKADFHETYRRLAPTGDIVSVHISKRQSLTGAHAEEAAAAGMDEYRRARQQEGVPGEPRIAVVDTWSNSVGQGMMVLFAARMVRRGLDVDEIVARLEAIRDRFQFLFVVDTLEFLQRGGRIGKAQAWFGTLLGIKPILGMKDGEVVPVDRVRGGRRAHPRIIELFSQHVDPALPVFAAMAHASAPKWAGRLRELLFEKFQILELVEGEIGPVVGTHTGPGAVGAILFQPTPEERALFSEPE